MDYKQIVGWIMEGVPFECRKPGSAACQEWEKFDLEDFADGAIADLLRQKWPAGWEFRLKPRTVKIGSREVEAPVLEPGDRRIVWCWDSDYNKPEEACQAAHDAIHALLRGEA